MSMKSHLNLLFFRNFHIKASVILALLVLSGHADELYPEISPDPAYEPEEVVGIQMRALGSNDVPFENAGIELTYRFASPGNRVNTGPIERFSTLFEIPAYQPMLNHTDLEIGPATQSEDTAFVPVRITGRNGSQAAYLFHLSKQTEYPYKDCWMTDSVVQINLPSGNSAIM